MTGLLASHTAGESLHLRSLFNRSHVPPSRTSCPVGRWLTCLKPRQLRPHSRFVRMDIVTSERYADCANSEIRVANTVKITAHYDTSKNQDHPVQGVFGGVAPQGQIAASLYTERWVLPKKSEVEISVEEGTNKVTSSAETPIETKEGVMRTVVGTYYMDANTAEAIGNWLLQKAADARAATNA
jgi:hypothetical protein